MSVLSSAEVLDHVSGAYQMDPAHSRLGFAVRYALVTKVHGRFDSFEGRAHLDASDPTKCSVALTIDATSIRTNNADRDGHLRSADFFDVERHPTITFESTGVTALGDRRYRATGDLTIKAITRPVAARPHLRGQLRRSVLPSPRRYRGLRFAEAERLGPHVECGARGRRSRAQ